VRAMGRLTHPPRPTAILAAAILCALALVPTTASAGIVPPPPIVTYTTDPASPNGLHGWFTSAVTVTFTVDDQGDVELSRSASCDNPLSNTIDTDTIGVDITCDVTTLLGGTGSATAHIELDTTDPILDPTISPSTTLVRNQTADADANASDTTSGIDTKGCELVDTSAVGTFSVECHATDLAGNTATQSKSYTVIAHGPAADVAATKGAHQVAYQNAQFASALVVTVTDQQGNPVPGETVAFDAPLTGPSADLSRPSDVTNDDGIASVRAFANNKVGSYQVTASIDGVGATHFALENARAPYLVDAFSNGLAKWKRTGDVSIATGAGKPAPSVLLRADHEKTFATHRFGDTYATACASAWVRVNNIGNEAVAILRFRGPGDSGISRVSLETDRELFVRNDRRGVVKLTGAHLPTGEWHELELCTHVGAKGSISLYLDDTKILAWSQRLGDRRIAAVHLIENDVKTFSFNVDGVIVDGRPGTPV
jgi:Big-like domain-containing protein